MEPPFYFYFQDSKIEKKKKKKGKRKSVETLIKRSQDEDTMWIVQLFAAGQVMAHKGTCAGVYTYQR